MSFTRKLKVGTAIFVPVFVLMFYTIFTNSETAALIGAIMAGMGMTLILEDMKLQKEATA